MRPDRLLVKKAQQGAWFHIPGGVKNTILISSMGRSGSTWLAQLLNHENNYREIFEPFLPIRVPEASIFEYCQYLAPKTQNPLFEKAGYKILTGRFRNEWTDSANSTLFARKQLIKDIRTNLMLGWLKEKFPLLTAILLIRHPYSVISSWKRLGWGVEPRGNRRDLDIILNQDQLLLDYPLITRAIDLFDASDYITELTLLWCILNYVPMAQNVAGQFEVVYYENLVSNPQIGVHELFKKLNLRSDQEKLKLMIQQPSKTAYRKTHFKEVECDLTPLETVRVREIVTYFGLNNLYPELEG